MNLHHLLTSVMVVLVVATAAPAQNKVTAPYFGIQVVDEQTGRGVPLIELRTVNDITHFTDSAGWVAFHEPGLMDREVYFGVSGPGYEHRKDGFGFRGFRVTPKAGSAHTVRVTRTNIAERLYRITGQGIHRDQRLLGLAPAFSFSNLNAGVLGQDSVQAVPYRGRLFWIWGDTNLPNYPLGNFQTTGATSPLPGPQGSNPEVNIPLSYFQDGERVRKMAPSTEPGPVWLFGLLTIPDEQGRESLVAHFSRRKSLGEQYEHGLMRFDDEVGIFKKLKNLDLKNTWRFPRGNAVRVREKDAEYFYFASPLCHTRVKAQWADLLDPTLYEAYSFDPKTNQYHWQRETDPTTQTDEQKLLKAGKLPESAAHYQITDTETNKPVQIHGGSVNWNPYRQRWILIGVQYGGKESLLGEVWYAEAEQITGPWRKAVKVASHPKYSFYNPRHHAFFDQNGGKLIYFEGTYTHTFSGNPTQTPRYDYNQILYRLDLSDPRLKHVQTNEK